MDEYKDYFVHGNKEKDIKGCVANKIPENKAIELWDVMALSASYSFNKSHAVAYSMHSIRTAWLSYYYPYEYLTAVLNSFSSDTDRLALYLNVARNNHMKILTPSINKSNLTFTTDGASIQAGLSGIKGVASGAKNIIEERMKNGNFNSLGEFLYRMSFYSNFTRRTIESLIYSGVFDEYEFTRHDLLRSLSDMVTYVKKEKEYRKKLEEYGKKQAAYTEQIKLYEEGLVKKPRKPIEPTKPVLEITETGREIPEIEKLLKEKEYTGMFLTGNPMDQFKELTKKYNDCSRIKNGLSSLCGIISNCEKKSSKKGKSFWTFKLENNGSINCVAFNYDGELEDDMIVSVSGKVETDEFGSSMMVNEINNLKTEQEILDEFRDVIIEVDNIAVGKKLRSIPLPSGTRTIYVLYNSKEMVFAKDVNIDITALDSIMNLVGKDKIYLKGRQN